MPEREGQAADRVEQLERELRDLGAQLAVLREHRALLLAERDDLARRLDRFHEPDFRLLSRVSRLMRWLLPERSRRRRVYQALRRLGRRPQEASRIAAPDTPEGDQARDLELALGAFEAQVRSAGAGRVVAVISATPLVERRGQRPTQLALALATRRIPVVFVHFGGGRLPGGPGPARAGHPASPPRRRHTAPRPSRARLCRLERLALVSSLGRHSATPSAPCARPLGVAYDVLDDWAEFHRVGHATWVPGAFERRLLAESDAVFAVNAELAARVARLGAAECRWYPTASAPASRRPARRPLPRGRSPSATSVTPPAPGSTGSSWRPRPARGRAGAST